MSEQATALVEKTKRRNYAVDFWRVFATLAVCWGHLNVAYRMTDASYDGALFTEGNILGVFLIFSGYFLMKSYQGKRLRGQLEGKTPRVAAVEYLKTRYFGLWPALVVGLLIGFAVNFYGYVTGAWESSMLSVDAMTQSDLNLLQVFQYNFLGSLASFLGLSSTGFLGNLGIAYAWNVPLWYISTIMVGGYFLYYGLCKNEDLMTGFIIPAILIICPSVWCLSELEMNDRLSLFCGLFDNALAFGVWGIALGMFLFHPYERFRKMKIGSKGKTWLTIISAILAVVLIWWEVKPGGNYWRGTYELFIDLYLVFLLAFCVAQQDGFTQKVLNRKVFSTLGEFSLYFFICHQPVIEVVSSFMKINSTTDYYITLLVVIALSAVGGILTQLICKKGIMPLMHRLDDAIRTATERGEEAALEAKRQA